MLVGINQSPSTCNYFSPDEGLGGMGPSTKFEGFLAHGLNYDVKVLCVCRCGPIIRLLRVEISDSTGVCGAWSPSTKILEGRFWYLRHCLGYEVETLQDGTYRAHHRLAVISSSKHIWGSVAVPISVCKVWGALYLSARIEAASVVLLRPLVRRSHQCRDTDGISKAQAITPSILVTSETLLHFLSLHHNLIGSRCIHCARVVKVISDRTTFSSQHMYMHCLIL